MFIGEKSLFIGEKPLFISDKPVFIGEKSLFIGGKPIFQSVLAPFTCMFFPIPRVMNCCSKPEIHPFCTSLQT